MLRRLSPIVRECLVRAAYARRKARRARDEKDRRLYERLEQVWHRLAEQYRSTEQINGFLGLMKRRPRGAKARASACRAREKGNAGRPGRKTRGAKAPCDKAGK